MKILVFSDSHGRITYMTNAVQRHEPDYIVHLGDKEEDGEKISALFPYISYISVPGNCDHNPIDPAVRHPVIGGVRFFMTHGHLHSVKYGCQRLYYAALEDNARVALFGHSHRPVCRKEGELWLLNPGCGALGTYGLITVENGDVLCEILREN